MCSEASGFVFEHKEMLSEGLRLGQPQLAHRSPSSRLRWESCRAAAHLSHPRPCAARRGWLGQRLPAHPCRCLHQHQIVSTRTSPFPAVPSRQGGIVLPRKGRGAAGAGAGRCGDAPKGSQTLGRGCCAQPGLADPSLLSEIQKHKLGCFFLLDAQSFFKPRVSSYLG